MTKLPLFFLLIVTNSLYIWSFQVKPKCTSRGNVWKYHKCMQSIYGIENVYREPCIPWNGMAVSRNITEPKCLHHLKMVSKSSETKKNQKKIEVTCPSYDADPAVHFPNNVTVEFHLQTSDNQCEQTEIIKFRFPERKQNAKPNPNCKKATWDQNGITVAGNLSGPRAIYLDQNDNLYVTDLNHRRLRKFSNSSKTGITIIDGTSGKPVDVCIDAFGNIFKATGEQWVVQSTGSASINFGNPTDQKDCIFGVVLNKETDMYVSKSLGNSSSMIRKYSSLSPKKPSSGLKKAVAARNKRSYAVFVDQCDTYSAFNHEEENIQAHLNSNRTPHWGYLEPYGLVPHHRYPSSMLYHFGSHYIAHREENCIIKLDQGVIVGVARKNNTAGFSFSVGFRSILSDVQDVRDLPTRNRSSTSIPVKTDPKQLNEPITIAFDSRSNLYVADFKNNRVQKFLLQSGSVKC